MKTKLSLKEKFAFKFIFNEKRVYQYWYGRFLLFQLDYGRIKRVIPRIHSWFDWCQEWAKEGDQVYKSAEAELSKGHLLTARQLFHQATACYHVGQHFYFIDKEQKEGAQQKARKSYQRAISLYEEQDRPLRIEIPYRGKKIPGYLHLSKEKNRPLIIQLNGMDNIKEAENHYFAQFLTPHGYNFFAFDGPGQGEIWKDFKFDYTEYPSVVKTIIDWFENNRYEMNISKISLFGFSLGGFLAPYCASFEENRVCCVVGNSGFAKIGGFRGAKKLKPLNLRGIPYMTGCEDLTEAVKKFDLDITAAPRLQQPLLYFHSGKDEVIPSPEEQAKIVMDWAEGEKELRFYPEATHCTVDYLDEVLPYIVDWYQKHLNS